MRRALAKCVLSRREAPAEAHGPPSAELPAPVTCRAHDGVSLSPSVSSRHGPSLLFSADLLQNPSLDCSEPIAAILVSSIGCVREFVPPAAVLAADVDGEGKAQPCRPSMASRRVHAAFIPRRSIVGDTLRIGRHRALRSRPAIPRCSCRAQGRPQRRRLRDQDTPSTCARVRSSFGMPVFCAHAPG